MFMIKSALTFPLCYCVWIFHFSHIFHQHTLYYKINKRIFRLAVLWNLSFGIWWYGAVYVHVWIHCMRNLLLTSHFLIHFFLSSYKRIYSFFLSDLLFLFFSCEVRLFCLLFYYFVMILRFAHSFIHSVSHPFSHSFTLHTNVIMYVVQIYNMTTHVCIVLCTDNVRTLQMKTSKWKYRIKK